MPYLEIESTTQEVWSYSAWLLQKRHGITGCWIFHMKKHRIRKFWKSLQILDPFHLFEILGKPWSNSRCELLQSMNQYLSELWGPDATWFCCDEVPDVLLCNAVEGLNGFAVPGYLLDPNQCGTLNQSPLYIVFVTLLRLWKNCKSLELTILRKTLSRSPYVRIKVHFST